MVERTDHLVNFLALADGELTRQRLYKFLGKLPASYGHLFIDACHAEAVIGARGAFGKEVDAQGFNVSDSDAQRILETQTLARFPNIGAVMATTRDQEAHEWSKIESGVFTHELLSGLEGAADVNGDGEIEYSEIEAFIASANQSIRDHRAVPHVVALAPRQNSRAPLVDLRESSGTGFLEGDFAPLGHFSIELEGGQRYLDANLGEGSSPRIAVPAGASLFVVAAGREAALKVGADQVVRVENLSFKPRELASRGSIESAYRTALFEQPFGRSFYVGFATATGRSPIALESPRPAETAVEPLVEPSNVRRGVAIGSFCLSGAALVAAGVTGGLTWHAKREFDQTDLQRPASEARDRYNRYGTAAVATGSLAAAAAIAGWLLWPDAGDAVVSLTLPSHGGAPGVSWTQAW